jgi:5'-nucleotidase
MRALITNDDGILSEGLHQLAHAAISLGLDVTVAAPSWDSSGASASLTAVQSEGRVLVHTEDIAGLDGHTVLGVEGSPAFIVRAAASGAFGDPPQIVLSGINNGPNTGHSVLHSGTVGAALTSSTYGLPSAAFSIGVGAAPHWDTAVRVACSVIGWLVAAKPGIVLNVNVPNIAPDALRGLAPATLASFGAVQTNVTEVGKGYVKLAYTDVDAELEPGTDAALLADGYAAVTPLTAVCEAAGVDVGALDLMQLH